MGALSGIKVIEVARVSPPALCARLLGDFGADILKVHSISDRPARLDCSQVRRARYQHLERNKRSIALNLKHPEGRGVLHRLAAGADVLVEGFRPGVMARLGCDFDSLNKINPRLIFCALSGFGQDGPYRDLPGHDLNYLSLSGALDLIGEPDGRPVIPLNLVADYGGAAMHAVVGILLALIARGASGQGQLVDVSYLDATVSLLAATPFARAFFMTSQTPQRGEGPIGGSFPYYTVYKTSDRKFISVACGEPWLWCNLCSALGRHDLRRFAARPEQANRRANAEEAWARDELQKIILQQTRDEWFRFFRDKNVCVAPVNTVEEAWGESQLEARMMAVRFKDETAGDIVQVGVPIKLSQTPGQVRFGGPTPGEHTEEVLTELGYSPAEQERLRSSRAVA